MAVAFDAVSNNSGNGTTVTVSHTCTGANLVLYVLVGERFSSQVTGVTYNGVAMTQISYNDGAGGNLVTGKVFRLVNPATGAHNIVVSQPGSHNLAVTGISVTGADQTTPNATVINSNAGPVTSISDVVPSVVGGLVLDLAVCMENTAGTRTLSVGGGQTQRSNQEIVNGGNGLQAAVSTEAGATNVTMSWTIDVADYEIHTAFSVNSASGDTTPPTNAVVTAQESPLGTAILLTIVNPNDAISQDISQYEIRSLTTDFPLNDRTNGTVIVAPTSTTPGVTISYSDEPLTNGERQFYRVFLKDTSGNWNAGTTVSEVPAEAMTVIGWYTQSGTFAPDGEAGANPIFEWQLTTDNVEDAKPVPFHIIIGSDQPTDYEPPSQDLIEFTSTDADDFAAGYFKYFDSSWITVPVAGVPWANVNAGTVTCRFYSVLNANQDLYAVVRGEQA